MMQLAEKLGVTTGTLTVSVDRLEERGLLRRVPHKTDRRSYLIELTEKGQEVFARHHKHHLNLTREIMTEFSEQEQVDLYNALKKMMKFF
jgi:DNA-binding MarR family transcriptional regulator